MTYTVLKRLNMKDPGVYEVSKGGKRYVAKVPNASAKRAHAQLVHDGIERILDENGLLVGDSACKFGLDPHQQFAIFEKIKGSVLTGVEFDDVESLASTDYLLPIYSPICMNEDGRMAMSSRITPWLLQTPQKSLI